MDSIRLDKWLWAARFYKTRAIARDMIEGGKVHYNGQRTKPSKMVEVGAMLQLRQGSDNKEVQILTISDKRGRADDAQKLYQETAESVVKREQIALARKLNVLAMPHPDRRPDKKERRDLIKFKYSHTNDN